ncbi:Galactose mutarotase N-terminal barrel [Trinorchestia longiramus]|nr:Galactose mutarotase N-terminal barrel [Trinorchestia longiramus]
MARLCQAFLLVGVYLLGLCGAQEAITSIECPLPGNPSTVTEEDCGLYTACVWDGDLSVCHMADNREAGYVFGTTPVDTGRGTVSTLVKSDSSVTMFGGDIEEVRLEVIHHEDHHLQIKLTDAFNARYEVPLDVTIPTEAGTDPDFEVSLGEAGQPVVINVTRRSNGNEIFRQIGPITFEDQFIQFTVRLPSEYLYGFGENVHPTLVHSFEPRVTYPIFTRDREVSASEAPVNHYGAFPYYMNVEDDEGNTHSVLFLNSNSIEYSTFTLPDGTPALTLRSIGGIIDLHIFTGPTPEMATMQYSTFVGKPLFPPYWSLGFQLSRWGYNSSDGVRAVRQRMSDAGIPQDVQFIDGDYMEVYHVWTYDKTNYSDLPQLVDELHDDDLHLVLIVDPGIAVNTSSYSTYEAGRQQQVFLKWMTPDLVPEDQPEEADDFMLGNVWPFERVAFPDFLMDNAKRWWSEEIAAFYESIHFDGLWIDMNEIANFDTSLGVENRLMCPVNRYDDPPYPSLAASVPVNFINKLADKTLCMSGSSADGLQTYMQYNVHSLYGHSEAIATSQALENVFPGKRPYVLTRSSYVGTGHYSFHWLGDNFATWEDMKASIIGVLEFNMFGIPMIGPDICGFYGHPTEELCTRWMEVGAFYPFSRNHNGMGEEDQDPASWPSVAEVSRNVLLTRYRYLPYLYALFHRAHMNGNSVARALFNVFPSDLDARLVDDQFMWGDGLMIAPVLTEGATSRSVYFPEAIWYAVDTEIAEVVGPATVEVDAPLEKIPLYFRGGSILPFQEPSNTTAASRLNDFGLLVALDEDLTASGEVFWDDGEMEHTMEETFLASVLYAEDELTVTGMFDRTAADGVNLGSVRVLGFPAAPAAVTVNGGDVDTFVYDDASQVLVVTVNLPLNEDLNIVFS